MKKPLRCLFVFMVCYSAVTAQKKSELFAKISLLEQQLDSLEGALAKSKRNEAASKTTALELQDQLKGVQEANTTLLQNLSNFAEVSKQNTTNAQRALENLNTREVQLKRITDIFSQNDSLAVVVVGKAKGVLGDTPQLGVGERSIAISYPVTTFFDDYKQAALNESGKATVVILASFLEQYPQYTVLVEGLSNTGEFDLTGAQANLIAFTLMQSGIDVKRIYSAARDGGFKDGFLFRLQPRFDQFYSKVKDELKNQ